MSQWPETWSCEKIRQQIEVFLDGELSAATMTQIRSHLDGCPDCAAQAHLAREIHIELGALPELDTPAPVLQQILDQTVRGQGSRRSLNSIWGRWPRPVWAALAAASLALVLGFGVLTQRSSTPAPPDAAAIAQATAEARYALARTGLLTRRAGLVIRDQALRDQIVLPTSRGLNQVLANPTQERSGASSEGVDDV